MPGGKKPAITLEVVKRVSERVGMGMPLKQALQAEGHKQINEGSWKMALKRHPEMLPHYESAKATFLDRAMRRLAEADQLKYLCWLLERRHPDLFARPAASEGSTTVNVNQTNHNVAIPADVLQRAKEIANTTNGR